MAYPSLNLPPANLKLSKVENVFYVWCIIRKKNLQLTPEEWVRQHVIHFLVYHHQTPIERINSEHLLKINGQNRRCDVVVVDAFGEPVLIVECKATNVPLDEKVLLQTSNYVKHSGAKFLWMTNGIQHLIITPSDPYNPMFNLPVL